MLRVRVSSLAFYVTPNALGLVYNVIVSTIYWSLGVLVTLLALVALYYYSCSCSPPAIK